MTDWVPESESLANDLGLGATGLSDSLIADLLNHHLTLPAHASIGILHLRGPQARRWWAPTETNEMSQLLADSAATLLRGIPRLERAVVMPALIVGDQRTISSLREGAARLQVDLLLVYRPSCRLYERTPFIGTTVWRSVCTLEAAVLDTRSGVLPFSTVVTAEQVTQREHGEFEDAEAQRRGELSATLLALRGLVDRLGAQLALIPVRSESARPN